MKTIGGEEEKTQTSPVQLWNYNKRAGLDMEKVETWKRWRKWKTGGEREKVEK